MKTEQEIIDVLIKEKSIDVKRNDSEVLKRLIDEIKLEKIKIGVWSSYDRVHDRHNRS